MGWKVRGVLGAGLAALAGCASVVGSTQSEVQIKTNPEQAHCQLRGYGFTATVDSPASVVIPHSASPVTLSCTAPGFRATSYTLEAKADGWIWGNSAFFAATGGIAVLGALVDESRGAGRAYQDQVQYDLTPERAREVRVRQRGADADMLLQAR